MINFKAYIKAARVPFLTATIVPVVLGAAVAWQETGRFNVFNFILTLLGIIFIHTGTNVANDYFDHRTGNDWLNKTPTPFSGGSRVIQEKLISAKGMLVFFLACFIAGALLGIWINYRLGTNIVLWMGVLGVFCGFFYTALPLRIGYSGLGELVVGLCFGPLVVMGSYYVQALKFSWVPFWASIPVGILIGLVLYINEFPDYEADKAVKKRTIVVRVGKEKAVKLYHALLVLTYLSIILGVQFKIMPVYAMLSLLTVPFLFKALAVSGKNFDKIYELLPANAMTIVLHLSIGILLSLGFILHKVL
ncbi:MAG: 1,4-dihydroxy-2-naphthoate octaprenyltransferase [Candidatus Omnitrophica bacterium]|nr:1,4-dihydroxy-2-naphthoate octaprenyltransferase [Candidatus Omnitrophota bacterium]